MEWILTQAVASFNFIMYLVDWSIKYPGAAIFWATIWSVVIDWAVTKSPWGWDDMLWGVLKNALSKAMTKVRER